MHGKARSLPTLSQGFAAAPYCLPPLLPSHQSAASNGNTSRQLRPRKRSALVTTALPKDKVDVTSTNRVAWSTRNAGRPNKLKAKRSLGQNFLQREEILLSIVKAAGISPGDRVLEIGPGTGALTRHLLRAGASLTAVEKDDSLYAQLTQDFAQVRRLSAQLSPAFMAVMFHGHVAITVLQMRLSRRPQEVHNGQLRLVHNDFLSEDAAALLQAVPEQTPVVDMVRAECASGGPCHRCRAVCQETEQTPCSVNLLCLV